MLVKRKYDNFDSAEIKRDVNEMVETTHQNDKTNACEECNRNYVSRSSFNLHIKQVHMKIKDYVCDQCSYTSSQKGSLDIHTKLVHSKIKDLFCDKCNYTCSLKGSLDSHIKQTRTRPFECKVCGYHHLFWFEETYWDGT
jgi:RNase P subunit RPR2